MSDLRASGEIDAGGEAPARGSAWAVLGWTLAALVAYLLFAFLAAAITEEEESQGAFLIQLIIGGVAATVVGFLVVPALALRRQAIRPPAWTRPTASDIGLATVILIASYGTLLVYIAIVQAIGVDDLVPQSTIENDDFRRTALVAVVTGVLVIGVAPLAEEFLFRRFVLGGLRAAWGAWPALLISAALFSVLHADIGSMIPFAIIGLIFGFGYLHSESLTAPTIAHLIFNIIGFSVTVARDGIG